MGLFDSITKAVGSGGSSKSTGGMPCEYCGGNTKFLVTSHFEDEIGKCTGSTNKICTVCLEKLSEQTKGAGTACNKCKNRYGVIPLALNTGYDNVCLCWNCIKKS